MAMNVLAAVAQFEHDLLIERNPDCNAHGPKASGPARYGRVVGAPGKRT
jgi:hypothetical protein